MTYIKVKWIHSFPDEPVVLYSELDDGRWEVRKVEVFRDGRRGFASASEVAGGTRLGKEPIPPLAEIAVEAQFEPSEIQQDEFEQLWRNRRGSRSGA